MKFGLYLMLFIRLFFLLCIKSCMKILVFTYAKKTPFCDLSVGCNLFLYFSFTLCAITVLSQQGCCWQWLCFVLFL